MQKTITQGINHIYAIYAEGKISKDSALEKLAAFLDSKGITDYRLVALATVKEWKR